MSDEDRIGFRNLAFADLPLLHRWVNVEPLLSIWTYGEGQTMEQLLEKYGPRIRGESPTESFVILLGDRPIGYIQWYLWRDYPDYAVHMGLQEEAASLDVFIGEADLRGRGLGPGMLRQFMREVIFARSQAVSCVITPDHENLPALRAYEKAGFRLWKVIEHPDEPTPVALLRISREEVMASGQIA